MARFYGQIGYGETAETAPGVWSDVVVEYNYFGEIIRNIGRQQDGEHLNKDISVNNSISILADAYANKNYLAIKYIRWNDILWEVNSVEIRRPRLILELGGVYDGPTPAPPSTP
jgi:hypothetical protein